ncbi:unnamed protein product [Cuscuta europaea]|uniref:Uncharacterized protein n=1 Tax=Cuscuta europaea TaxID=41803 RepID=A0A9P1E4P0_CUSEU|nr:unnamed protein product [Cuscuta europaea]
MGPEGIRILQNSKGASSSSYQVYDERDERVVRLEKQLAEREEEDLRSRERLAEFERQMNRFNATYRPPMHIQQPEMTPQNLLMGGMRSMGGMGFGNYSTLSNTFPYSYYDQPFQTPRGCGS